MGRDAPNLQALWGDLIVEELVRCGVRRFVVCPGSRSTPLVAAIGRNPRARAAVWLDERGAAFFALGHGRAGEPAAVITTSGTAVANLLPAVVEASMDAVPLVLLTADRPPELQQAGANQSIVQPGLFGRYVRWAFDLPAPDERVPARMVLTTVDRAVHAAAGGPHPGPVHLNCPFREPLAPSEAAWDAACLDGLERWEASEGPFTRIEAAPASPPFSADALSDLAAGLARARAGLVVLAGSHDASGALALGERLGWPVWRDRRFAAGPEAAASCLLPHVDRLLGTAWRPEVVLQVGGRPTSRHVGRWLAQGGARDHVVVDPTPERVDPDHRTTRRFVGPVGPWCDALADALQALDLGDREVDPTLRAAHQRLAEAVDAAVQDGEALTEPWVARHLTEVLDDDHALFVSNSMPVRDVQAYGVAGRPRLAVVANRGASGIDGIPSTAAGLAQARGGPVTLLVGDLALLHDVNALAGLSSLEQPVTIVVLNNGGGSIFSFLPVAEHPDVLTPYVETPHDIGFEGICRSFGLPHERVSTREDLARAYREATASGASRVIEVASSLADNRAHHERIEAAIDRALA